MDALTYSRPVDPACVGQVNGPDRFGAFYELVAVEVLPDGRGRARFQSGTPAALAARDQAGIA